MIDAQIMATQNDIRLVQIQKQIVTNELWDVKASDILEDIITRRFEQHVTILQLLINIENEMPFANACPYDRYLGIGISSKEL